MNIKQPKRSSEDLCPSCGKELVWDDVYIVWCESCDYNINPLKKEMYLKKIDIIYEKLGRKFGVKMFQQVSERQLLRPRFSLTRLIAYILASFIHTVSLIFLVSGIFFILKWPEHFGFGILGLFLLGVAWATRPRFGQLDKQETVVSRNEHPILYQVIDDLCMEAGVSRIDGIVIDHQFNASISTIGWRGKKILTIGLPLFTILPKEERLALLGHEIGHLANRDLARTVYVGGALTTLATWYELLEIHSIDEMDGILGLISAFFMKGLAQIPFALYLLIVHLLWQDMQRAEYYADLVAAKLSGTKASISLMEKILFNQTFFHVVQKAAVTRDPSSLLFHLRNEINELPPKEIRRLKRLSQLELSKLNFTHPPNAYRIQFLEKQPFFRTHFYLTEEQNKRIDLELVKHEDEVQNKLVSVYLNSLYY